jgi:hypothetical protein
MNSVIDALSFLAFVLGVLLEARFRWIEKVIEKCKGRKKGNRIFLFSQILRS